MNYELIDIECFQSNRYEPYVAFQYCDALPPFQEQFRGYGKNKVAWVRQMRWTGYIFQQLLSGGRKRKDDEKSDNERIENAGIREEDRGAFLVHFPHSESESRKEWNRRPKVLSISKVPRDSIGVTQDKRGSGTKVDIAAVNWTKYKRGRVDSLYLDFRYWLEQEVVD